LTFFANGTLAREVSLPAFEKKRRGCTPITPVETARPQFRQELLRSIAGKAKIEHSLLASWQIREGLRQRLGIVQTVSEGPGIAKKTIVEPVSAERVSRKRFESIV
jgi:hypothetical protein